MLTQTRPTTAARDAASPIQPPRPDCRNSANSRHGGGLARCAAAAVELPFSALFYWVD